jgi:hypothetical protein
MAYYNCGDKKTGKEMTMRIVKNCEDDINYILSLDDVRANNLKNDVQRDATIINILSNVARNNGDMATADELGKKIDMISQRAAQKLDMQAQAPQIQQ